MKIRKADLGWGISLFPLTMVLLLGWHFNFLTFFLGSHSCMSANAIATETPHVSLQIHPHYTIKKTYINYSSERGKKKVVLYHF